MTKLPVKSPVAIYYPSLFSYDAEPKYKPSKQSLNHGGYIP